MQIFYKKLLLLCISFINLNFIKLPDGIIHLKFVE